MLVNRRTVRIEFGDCDPAGIVWYPRYFGFFDGATAGLFEAAGWKKSELPKAFGCIGFPMVDTRAKFHIPSRYCEDIIIESRVTEWRRSSFDVEHKVFKRAPDARHWRSRPGKPASGSARTRKSPARSSPGPCRRR